jgi:hypothetical protein
MHASRRPWDLWQPVEILSLFSARYRRASWAILTIRPDPEESLDPMTFRLSQDQAVFLRDVLDRYLNDKRSPLYMPEEAQRALRL